MRTIETLAALLLVSNQIIVSATSMVFLIDIYLWFYVTVHNTCSFALSLNHFCLFDEFLQNSKQKFVKNLNKLKSKYLFVVLCSVTYRTSEREINTLILLFCFETRSFLIFY